MKNNPGNKNIALFVRDMSRTNIIVLWTNGFKHVSLNPFDTVKRRQEKKTEKKTANAMSDYIAEDIAIYLMDATQIRSKKKTNFLAHIKSQW